MARRHGSQLNAPAVEKSVAANEQRVGPLAPKSCEGHIDLAAGAGSDDRPASEEQSKADIEQIAE
jgi:hypothetical protein